MTREKKYAEWLMQLPREQMRKLINAHESFKQSIEYTIKLSPELYSELRQVVSLNRRMLDRGPEHQAFDTILNKLMEQCAKQADAQWDANWPADVPKPPDEANPFLGK